MFLLPLVSLGYKQRWFRLKGNLLFYFRVDDAGQWQVSRLRPLPSNTLAAGEEGTISVWDQCARPSRLCPGPGACFERLPRKTVHLPPSIDSRVESFKCKLKLHKDFLLLWHPLASPARGIPCEAFGAGNALWGSCET